MPELEDKLAINTIDARMAAKMFLAGAGKLESQKERINDLNVFPVPDGDTGTNMTLTIMSAAHEVDALESPTFATLAKAVSGGSLKGARGNSGVIFSQLCRGFSKEMEGVEHLDVKRIARATQRACETAYKAVMKPKEGTILTVAKGVAEKARELAGETSDMEEALRAIIEHAEYVLSKTPDMLPVLKEAGVVDSGGQGLVCVLHGFFEALTGKDTGLVIEGKAKISAPTGGVDGGSDIKFGYCTEFIIKLNKEFSETDEMEFKEFLNDMGDSIVCVALDDIVKVHVHTNHPGEVFERGLSYGQLTRMKVDNMREEHETNRLVSDEEVAEARKNEAERDRLPVAFLSVVAGDGLAHIFKDQGAAGIISGGQTMNPSTNDILEAAGKINAETIFVLPNNSNIILAATQAAELCTDSELVVIPTKTVPQGIAATFAFDPHGSAEEIKEGMLENITMVRSGQVTYAVRDTTIDGTDIKKGDYIAINDDGLAASKEDIEAAVFEMLDKMVDNDSELVSVYYGADVKSEEAGALFAKIQERYPKLEADLQEGGQPVYYYFVSVE